jgi:hypothetical protein
LYDCLEEKKKEHFNNIKHNVLPFEEFLVIGVDLEDLDKIPTN